MNASSGFPGVAVLRTLALGLSLVGGAVFFTVRLYAAPPMPAPGNTPVVVASTTQPSSNDVGYPLNPYTFDEQGVYYMHAIIPGADPKTFSFISAVYGAYGKDAIHVYLQDKTIPGADPATFTPMTSDHGEYSKDAQHVYLGTTVLAEADPHTFTVLLGGFAKDAQHVYYEAEIVPQTDPKFFSVIKYNDGAKNNIVFAKDSRHVFYEGGWGQTKPSVIVGADPKSFLTLDNDNYAGGYSKDAHAVYWADRRVNGADPNTFQDLAPYGKDAHAVYLGLSIAEADYSQDNVARLDGADPKTFVVLSDPIISNDGAGYSKDAHAVYLYDRRIPGADPATFVPPP
jgi:hypothetical protein